MPTATLPPPTSLPDELSLLSVKRFTVAEYHRLIETGILSEDDRCELIHGWIVPLMPPDPPHAFTVRRVRRFLDRLIPDEYVVGIQDPVTLTDSEPMPDLFVVIGPDDRYTVRHPGPRDMILAVEVADTSVRYDRRTKGPMYAAARIPIYWIVNIPDRIVEVYTQPRGGKSPVYRTRTDYAAGADIPVVLRGTTVGTIPTSSVLPG